MGVESGHHGKKISLFFLCTFVSLKMFLKRGSGVRSIPPPTHTPVPPDENENLFQFYLKTRNYFYSFLMTAPSLIFIELNSSIQLAEFGVKVLKFIKSRQID